MGNPPKILAYVDSRPESVVTLERAVEIAKRIGARVTALDVVSNQWPRLASVDEGSIEARRSLLEYLAGRHRQERVAIDVAVRTGTPSAEIIRAVVGEDHDLVIKSARGHSEGALSLFGNTAIQLIRKCPCPVWVLGPVPMARRPKVLAAIDPGWDGDAVSSALSQKVLAHATGLATQIGGDMHVLHAWGITNEHLLRRYVSASELQRFSAEEKAAAHRRIMFQLLSFGTLLPPNRIQLVKGHPDIVIPAVANRDNFDVLVMGSVGRSGLAGLLIGEMAEEMLARTNCSVLTVKPDGFETSSRPAA